MKLTLSRTPGVSYLRTFVFPGFVGDGWGSWGVLGGVGVHPGFKIFNYYNPNFFFFFASPLLLNFTQGLEIYGGGPAHIHLLFVIS